MKRIGSTDSKMKSVRDSSSSPQLDNSLEVISDGLLSDIARPSFSRGSTRSLSQLSMKGSTLGFELESLPVDRSYQEDLPDGDLFLEEAVADDYDNDEFGFSTNDKHGGNDVDYRTLAFSTNEGEGGLLKSSGIRAYSDRHKRNTERSSVRQQSQSEDDLNSAEFESEIFKIAKRIRQPKLNKDILMKNARKNSKTASPVADDVRSESCLSNSEEAKKENQVDPRVKKGLEKIRKLDNILAEKIKLEKETKADRKRMEREWQLEVQSFVEWCGENKSKPIIQQFLALTNGVGDFQDKDEDDNISPLFQTEVDTDFDNPQKKNLNSLYGDSEEGIQASDRNNDSQTKEESCKEKGSKSSSKQSRKKDFVKRNIELASHAKEIVSLTEEEQKRLDELLSDDSDLLMIDNPFSKQPICKPPSGFELDNSSKQALLDIDEKLKCLVPGSDFESICFSPRSEFENQSVSSRSIVFSEGKGNLLECDSKYGEHSLKQGKEYRVLRQRLEQIELELEKLGNRESEGSSESPRISEELLKQLLEVDSRLTSSALSILNSARSNFTQRTESATIIDDQSESLLDDDNLTVDTARSFCSEKSFHSVGV